MTAALQAEVGALSFRGAEQQELGEELVSTPIEFIISPSLYQLFAPSEFIYNIYYRITII